MILPKLPLSVNIQIRHFWQPDNEQQQLQQEAAKLLAKRDSFFEVDAPPPATTSSTVNHPNPSPLSSTKAVAKAPYGSTGFFDPNDPGPPPPPPKPSSSSKPCLSPGSTVTYIDANGTTHNYTNLGGNCLGLDVGETGSSNVTSSGSNLSLHDPFFASVTPQTFALAGATIAAAILLILLFLSRSRKPWIQKIATFAMTTSLIAYMVISVNMLETQYAQGRYDSDALRGVNQNLICKIFAYIAEVAIYLAQVQTLMRIFPRKRDKVIIKWTGFCLIALTMIFAALYQFLRPSAPPPSRRSTSWQIFLQILPPLNYLFSIALATIYALCVFYYGIIHRRVAFRVPAGLILAFLSMACITMPIIFFCLDIWAQFVVGWGQYIRSTASIGSIVIVWEWIERVDEEELTRDGKSGVLGRRIFEDEFDTPTKTPGTSMDGDRWKEWSKKIRVPSMFSGISDKASEWSLKLQSKLDRRTSNTPATAQVTELALQDLNSSSSTGQQTIPSGTPTTSDDTRTTTTGDDYTTYTGTSATSSFSPLVGGKRPKKKHHYPIARSANRTRQLTHVPTSQPSPLPFVSSTDITPSSSTSLQPPEIAESSSNAPSFHSRESDDRRNRFSVLPGFSQGDYFLDGEVEKRGVENGRIDV
jgi:hypothetical protein